MIPITIDRTFLQKAHGCFVEAFFEDDLMGVVFPNPSRRREKMKHLFHYIALTRHYEAYATSPQCEGLVLWERPGSKGKFPLGVMWRSLVLVCRVGLLSALRLRQFQRLIESMRKKHMPLSHWYLSLLCVSPHHQGKGYGKALVAPMLERVAQAGYPVYLETQKASNVVFYERLGFSLKDQQSCLQGRVVNYAMCTLVDRVPTHAFESVAKGGFGKPNMLESS